MRRNQGKARVPTSRWWCCTGGWSRRHWRWPGDLPCGGSRGSLSSRPAIDLGGELVRGEKLPKNRWVGASSTGTHIVGEDSADGHAADDLVVQLRQRRRHLVPGGCCYATDESAAAQVFDLNWRRMGDDYSPTGWQPVPRRPRNLLARQRAILSHGPAHLARSHVLAPCQPGPAISTTKKIQMSSFLPRYWPRQC